MSLSPFSRDNRPVNSSPSPSSIVPSKPSDSPLTLSQALTITAGLAGLIGLLSGGVMRFSLSKSSNARFLSPLQTFPTLSDWSSKTAATSADPFELNNTWENNDIDSWERRDDLNWQTGRDFDEFSSESFTEFPASGELTPDSSEERVPLPGAERPRAGEALAPSNFDDFADRQAGRQRTSEDALKSLSEGPLLWKTESSFPAEGDAASRNEALYDEEYVGENLSEEGF